MGVLLEEVFVFFFLLVLKGLAFGRGFKVKSPCNIGGTSTRWTPLSPKFLTCSLMSDHHDLNLSEGSPFLMGEVKGISRLVTKIFVRFSFLKVREATTASKAKVGDVLVCLGQNQIGRQTYWGCRFEFYTHLENVPEDEKEKHKQHKKVLPQTRGYLYNEKQKCFLKK